VSNFANVIAKKTCFFCHFYWNDHERLYRLLGPPNLQMPSSDDQKLKDEVLLFFYVELSEVIPQKLIFGRHVSKKLTFWETVSDEIPKSSFFRRLVAESFQIKDWPPIPVRPAPPQVYKPSLGCSMQKYCTFWQSRTCSKAPSPHHRR